MNPTNTNRWSRVALVAFALAFASLVAGYHFGKDLAGRDAAARSAS